MKKLHMEQWIPKSVLNKSGDISTFFKAQQLTNITKNFSKIINPTLKTPDVFTQQDSSLTDGKVVGLASNITEHNADCIVGIILHELSHIKYTDFVKYTDARLSEHFHIQHETYKKTFNTVFNILEDFRIDDLMYKKYVGYRPYYEAMFDELFFSPKVTNLIKQDQTVRKPGVIQNYYFWLLSSFHPDFDREALPRLGEMVDIIDLKNIHRFTDNKGNASKKMFKAVHDICTILVSVMPPDTDLYGWNPDIWGEETYGIIRTLINWKNGWDIPLSQLDYNKGNLKSRMLSESIKDDVQLTGAEDYEFNGTQVPVYSVKVTTSNHPKDVNTTFYDEGILLGKILSKKLLVRNDELTDTKMYLPAGQINRRHLHKIPSNEYNIFQRNLTAVHKPAIIYLSLDGSHSMLYKDRWNNCVKLAAAIGYFSKMMTNVEVIMAVRHSIHDDIMNVTVFDSRINSLVDLRKGLIGHAPSGFTPEGLVFPHIIKTLNEIPNTNKKYFINISDGGPDHQIDEKVHYAGKIAVDHTRKMVNAMVRSNINILSYFVGTGNLDGERRQFEEMYGNAAKFISPEDISGITNTLNKLLKER